MHNHISSNKLLAFVLIPLLLGAGCSESTSEPPDVSCADPGDICTIMGTGRRAQGQDERPPLGTDLYYPIDLTFDAEGRLIVLDYNNQYVRRLDHDGLVRRIMGTGFEDYVQDGSAALETSLHHAYSFAYDAAGNLYLAGNHVSQIIRLGTDDRAWIVAGQETHGYSGDGGAALEAEMQYPCGVAVAADGFPIFVADTYNNVIRVVEESGSIRTIAGDGTPGYSGDNGPAEEARLDHPFRIRYHEAAGDLYIADRYNNAVRRIDSEGIITTIAGTGVAGFGPGGGAGTETALREPLDARPGPDGAVYIADAGNNRLLRLDPATGIISTVAGTGAEGNSGDGGPAVDAELHYPVALTFDDDGNLWFCDSYNSTIRKIQLNP
jgi:sugar lactone lactonase YvrE